MSTTPSHFSTKPSKEEEMKVRELDANYKKGPTKHLMRSYVTVRCPECQCILQAPKANTKKEWITKCKHHHCYLINIESGVDRMKYERIPRNDSRYLQRNLL